MGIFLLAIAAALGLSASKGKGKGNLPPIPPVPHLDPRRVLGALGGAAGRAVDRAGVWASKTATDAAQGAEHVAGTAANDAKKVLGSIGL